jgi:transcriptional regulator with XRE-family HTH domain
VSEFGQWLHHARQDAGLAQQRDLIVVLHRLGCPVSKTSVSLWHKGSRVPRGMVLRRLLDALGIYGEKRHGIVEAVEAGADWPSWARVAA